MILVTGATGTIGSALVRALLARGEEVAAMTRDPAKINRRPGLTATTEIGKADAIFLLAPPGPGVPASDRVMLRAAQAAGIPRAVKLSSIGTPDSGTRRAEPGDPTTMPESWHLPGELAVRDSGLAWTILRPTSFASNTLGWAADIRARRPIANVFGDGRQGVVDPADIAALAAEVLLGAGHDGQTYTLTGPDLLSVPDQAAQLAEVLGIEVTTVDVPPEEARAAFPPEIADMAMAGAALVRGGGNTIVTDDVARVLGRPPGTFRAWAEANRTRF
jgi:uncharacterized protein YbjT (DUF2867 family)